MIIVGKESKGMYYLTIPTKRGNIVSMLSFNIVSILTFNIAAMLFCNIKIQCCFSILLRYCKAITKAILKLLFYFSNFLLLLIIYFMYIIF